MHPGGSLAILTQHLLVVLVTVALGASTAWWGRQVMPTAKAAEVGPDINATADLFTVFGEWTYFRQRTETSGDELWRTNGFQTELVTEVGGPGIGGEPESLTVWKGWLWFILDDREHGNELWRTNGTSTELFIDRNPGAVDVRMPYDIYTTSDHLYFGSINGFERIDIAGNREVVLPLQACYLRGPAGYNDNLGSNPLYIAPNGSFFAYCSDEEIGEPATWDLYEVTRNLTVRRLTQSLLNCGCGMGRPLLQDDGSWIATWTRVDGVPFAIEGLQLIKISADGATIDYEYAFVPGEEGNPREDVASFEYEVLSDGTMYTWGWDDEHGFELWKVVDGLASRIYDLLPGEVGSSPTEISKYKNTLLFTASDGENRGLYYLDGVTPVEISAPDGVTMNNPRKITVLGDMLFFVADDESETARVYSMNLVSVVASGIRLATSTSIFPTGLARTVLSGTPGLAEQFPAGAEYVGPDGQGPLMTSSVAAYAPFSIEEQESVATLRVDSLAGKPAYLSGMTLLGGARPNYVSTSDPGIWAGIPAPTFRYQWYVCSTRQRASALPRVPSGCRAIRGATAETYVPNRRDLNKYLRVLIQGVNEEGSRSYVSPPVQVRRR